MEISNTVFADLVNGLAAAASKGDGNGVADLFAENGEYHDVFYGTFTGRAAICDMNAFATTVSDMRGMFSATVRRCRIAKVVVACSRAWQ